MLDSRFALRSKGALYVPLYLGRFSLGYGAYQLIGCDMAAVDAELRALLGMAAAPAE